MNRHKSALFGSDNDVLPILIKIHANTDSPHILDVTYNSGKMWKGLSYDITTLDIDPSYNTQCIGDCRNLSFKDESFDVVVFDPPHMPITIASKNSSRIWEKHYGLNDKKGMGRDNDNINDLFFPFLKEANRVLKSNGIILAKIIDIIHNHRYQWQHVEFVKAAQQIGMTACDMMIKVDPKGGNIQSSKWKNVKHLRRNHAYWIVIRKGNKCECSKTD